MSLATKPPLPQSPAPTLIEWSRIDKVVQSLNQWLDIGRFRDYCPNGLQVAPYPCERRLIKLAYAVSASLSVIQRAQSWGADALLVHHGYFWKNDALPLTGIQYQRLKALIDSGMALIAYHLPLDAHPLWGNNAQWGKKLGITIHGHFGDNDLGCWSRGSFGKALALTQTIGKITQRSPLLINPQPKKIIRTLGWCSGGASSYFQSAIDQGVDAFITGEASEPVYHLAWESGVAFIAAGHDATERGGVQAIAKEIRKNFHCQIKSFFEANPI